MSETKHQRIVLSPDHCIILPDCDEHSYLRYLKKISAFIGSNHIHSVFKNNGLLKFYFSEEKFVNKIIDSGILLNCDQLQICRTGSTMLKVILSEVDPIIPDNIITDVLKTYGSLESPIEHIKVSKNVQFDHIYSGTREVKMKVFNGLLLPQTLQLTYNNISYQIGIKIVKERQTVTKPSVVMEKKEAKNDKPHFLNSVDCDPLSLPLSIENFPEGYKDNSKLYKGSRSQNIADLIFQIHSSAKYAPIKNSSNYNKENNCSEILRSKLKFPVIQDEQFMAYNKKYVPTNVSKYMIYDRYKGSSKTHKLSSSSVHLFHQVISNKSNTIDLCPNTSNSYHHMQNELKSKRKVISKSKNIRNSKFVAMNSVNNHRTKVVNSKIVGNASSKPFNKRILIKKKCVKKKGVNEIGTKSIFTSLINSTLVQSSTHDHNQKNCDSNLFEKQNVVSDRNVSPEHQENSDLHLNPTSTFNDRSLEIEHESEEQIKNFSDISDNVHVSCMEKYEENSICDLTTSSSLKPIVFPDSSVMQSNQLISNIKCSTGMVDSSQLKAQSNLPEMSSELKGSSNAINTNPLLNESVENTSLFKVNDHAAEISENALSSLIEKKNSTEKTHIEDENANLSSKSILFPNRSIDEMDCIYDNSPEEVNSFESNTQTIQEEVIKGKCNDSISSDSTFVSTVAELSFNTSEHDDHLSETCNVASSKESVCENNSNFKGIKESVDLNIIACIPSKTTVSNSTKAQSKSYAGKISHKFYNNKDLKTHSIKRKIRSKSSSPIRDKSIPEYEFDNDDSDSNHVSYNKWKHQKFFPNKYFKSNLSVNKRNLTPEDIDNIYCLSSDLTLDFNNPHTKNKKKNKNRVKQKSIINSFNNKKNFANYFKSISFNKTVTLKSSKIISNDEKIARKKYSFENIGSNMQKEISLNNQKSNVDMANNGDNKSIYEGKMPRRSSESSAIALKSFQDCWISNEDSSNYSIQKAPKGNLECSYSDCEKVISKPFNSKVPCKSSASDLKKYSLNLGMPVKENQQMLTSLDGAPREHISHKIVLQRIHDKNSLNQTGNKKSAKTKWRLKSKQTKIIAKVADNQPVNGIKYNDKSITVNNQKHLEKEHIKSTDMSVSVTPTKEQESLSINTECSNLHKSVDESIDSISLLALEQNEDSEEEDFHSCVNGFLQQLASSNQHNGENGQNPCESTSDITKKKELKNRDHLVHKLDRSYSSNVEECSVHENETVGQSSENVQNKEQSFSIKKPCNALSKQDSPNQKQSPHKVFDSSLNLSNKNLGNLNTSHSVLTNNVSNQPSVTLKKCSIVIKRLPEVICNMIVSENELSTKSDESSINELLTNKPCEFSNTTVECESINEEIKSNENVTHHSTSYIYDMNNAERSDSILIVNNKHVKKESCIDELVVPSASFTEISDITLNDRSCNESQGNIDNSSQSGQNASEHFNVSLQDSVIENNALIKCEENSTSTSCSSDSWHNSGCDFDKNNQFEYMSNTNIKLEFYDSSPSYEMGSIYELDEQPNTDISPLSICNKTNDSHDFSSHNYKNSLTQSSQKIITSTIPDAENEEILNGTIINVKQEPVELLDFQDKRTDECNLSCNVNNVLPNVTHHCFPVQRAVDSHMNSASIAHVQNLSDIQNLAKGPIEKEQSSNRIDNSSLNSMIHIYAPETATLPLNLTQTCDNNSIIECRIPKITSVRSAINNKSNVPLKTITKLNKKSNHIESTVPEKIVLLHQNYDAYTSIDSRNSCTFQVTNPVVYNTPNYASRYNCSNEKQDFLSNYNNTHVKMPFYFDKSSSAVQPKIKSIAHNNIEKDVNVWNSTNEATEFGLIEKNPTQIYAQPAMRSILKKQRFNPFLKTSETHTKRNFQLPSASTEKVNANVTSNSNNKIVKNFSKTSAFTSRNKCNSINSEEVLHCKNNSPNLVNFNENLVEWNRDVQNNQNCIDLRKKAVDTTSINKSNLHTSCIERSNISDNNDRARSPSTLNSVETHGKSVAVKPKQTDIYSVYKNISSSKKNKIPKSFINFPLTKKKLLAFIDSAIKCRNPKEKAMQILEINNTPGALKDLILQLYDFFKKCNDDQKRLQISSLIMLLNDRTIC
ncbi:uncharacterized protein TNIN_16761 [Trichonephila inaurata madagascariensis]|uniref:Uncharacterized protein n=1 Tax=Trichonephila inaurata madagascariensis TaxID=2747483 RepID=A0A8X6XG06_9ARAC|nr:uncharacterized protein TNIN_16761 [Trichonephila inaurata madagascariensis]